MAVLYFNYRNTKERAEKISTPYNSFLSVYNLYHLIRITLPTYDPLIVLSHTIHETEWGRKCYNFNLFGIKFIGSGQFYMSDTTEGYKQRTRAKFRSFLSFSDCLMFYDDLIQRAYPEAYQSRSDYREYFKHLIYNKANRRWATHCDKHGIPIYDKLLINLYGSVKKYLGG